MKKQRKVVSGRNYQTAGQPYESMPHSDRPASDRPVTTDVKKESTDRKHKRATVVPERKKQRKVVSGRNYQTAGQPYESMPHSDRPASDRPVTKKH
jgi:hypothetical protein